MIGSRLGKGPEGMLYEQREPEAPTEELSYSDYMNSISIDND